MQNWSNDGTRLERTGWRDQAISERHRAWGFNCPAVDLDFVMAEYNHGLPVAIIEYKDRRARLPRLTDPTYAALIELADGYRNRGIPFLVAFYDSIDWWFRVIPGNESAHKHYAHVAGEAISEQRFVRGLYVLRKAVLTAADEAVIAKLSSIVPTDSQQ